MLITIALILGVGFMSYWRGHTEGQQDAYAKIKKPAVDFLEAFYPFGVPDIPKNDLDVMAQVLEPLTKL